MSGKTPAPAWLETAPAAIACLMLAVALLILINSHLLSIITEMAGLSLSAYSIFLDIGIIVVVPSLALLRLWDERRLRAVMYLSFVLYLPFAIYFSGVYQLITAGGRLGLDVFSTGLPKAAIAAAGILLACGGLLLQTMSHACRARENFLQRGADAGEADPALRRGVVFEAKLIAASTGAVLLLAIGVWLVEPAVMWLLESVGFFYVLAGMGAALTLGLIILVYARPMKPARKDKSSNKE